MADAPSTPAFLGLLTPQQTADRIGVSPSTLKRLRLRGEGPQAVRITERTIRYCPSKLDAWLADFSSSPENSGK